MWINKVLDTKMKYKLNPKFNKYNNFLGNEVKLLICKCSDCNKTKTKNKPKIPLLFYLFIGLSYFILYISFIRFENNIRKSI